MQYDAERLNQKGLSQKEREEAYQQYMLKFVAGYFDTKRDEDGMADWVRLFELGCFGQEFRIYGIAYEENGKPTYRASGNGMNLFEFNRYATLQGIYPTPVTSSLKRQTCPSGCEDMLKRLLKRETAIRLKETYSESYFEAMHQLGAVEANNEAEPLLRQMQDYLDGRYEESELKLFEGLLLNCVDRKRLTPAKYAEFRDWLDDVYRQLENDIIVKARYEKHMSGFAWIEKGKVRYFTDAFLQATYEEHQARELEGKLVTPIYEKKYWMMDMGSFRDVRQEFDRHIRECFDEDYFSLYRQILNLKSPVPQSLYEAQKTQVEQTESPAALENIMRYGRRFGVENYIE